jgi:hypothetical protein
MKSNSVQLLGGTPGRCLHETGMKNCSDRSEVISLTGPNRLSSDRDDCKHKYISERSLCSWLPNNACSQKQCKFRKWRARGIDWKICDIFVPVAWEHIENFDFYPGFTSTRSHINSTLRRIYIQWKIIARSIFCDRLLLKCVQSTAANEICSARLFVFQKKAIEKSRSRDILHWMEICLL